MTTCCPDLLKEVLIEWREDGWPLYFGRAPGPDDLIVPNQHGKCRTVRNSLKRIKLACDLLGVAPVLPSGEAAPVTQHVTRNTFITLASADGAGEQWLKRVTHGQKKGNPFDGYRMSDWGALCEAVLCLKVESPKSAPVVHLPATAGAGGAQNAIPEQPTMARTMARSRMEQKSPGVTWAS